MCCCCRCFNEVKYIVHLQHNLSCLTDIRNANLNFIVFFTAGSLVILHVYVTALAVKAIYICKSMKVPGFEAALKE